MLRPELRLRAQRTLQGGSRRLAPKSVFCFVFVAIDKNDGARQGAIEGQGWLFNSGKVPSLLGQVWQHQTLSIFI
ncbi:hypothetical protein [Motiliproteus coralliicola]|uniref:hypothetical protein n=1 Tax=Motiliproteus coralliicola TaxID=2283196 RepID=UPI000E09842D|nr:hypothetical protein [Motiliproteus coralliicola]